MSLGIGLGISLTSRRRAPFTPAALPSLAVWGRGDDADVTIVSDAYDAIPNRGDTGAAFTAPAAGNRPAVSTDWGGKTAPQFDGTDDRLVLDAALADLVFLHDGVSNCTLSYHFRTTSLAANQEWGTFDRNPVNRGISFLVNNTNGAFSMRWGNGSGTLALTLSGGTAVVNTDHVVQVVKTGAACELFFDGTSVASGTISSPSTDNPQLALAFVTRSTAAVILNGFAGELAIHKAAHGSAQRTAMREYLQRWEFTGS